MQGVILERVTQEKDLGVVIDTGGKQAAQCQAAIGRANRVLGCFRRGVNYKSKEVVITLYRYSMRPQLEYCVQFWSPQFQKDIAAIKRVQRRATRWIPGRGAAESDRALYTRKEAVTRRYYDRDV